MDQSRVILDLFWDLASNDTSKRISAGVEIVNLTDSRNATGTVSDAEYVVKRLVRGLSSSRDSARQGFAASLVHLLTSHAIDLNLVLDILDDSTKVTGSVKRFEERELLFGKLFGLLCVVRSKRLNNDKVLINRVLDSLLVVHSKRNWIREVTSDAILFFLSQSSAEVVEEVIIPKLLQLLCSLPQCGFSLEDGKHSLKLQSGEGGESLEGTKPWELIIATGLVAYCREKIPHIVCRIPSSKVVQIDALDEIASTLLSATRGFPQISRVWDLVFAEIFEMDVDFRSQRTRVTELSENQERRLAHFIQFIERYMIGPSQERRCVAFHLVCELSRLCPSQNFPIVLSSTIVKSLIAARSNKAHILYTIAGNTIEELVQIALTACTSDVRLSMAHAFTRFGGANFDEITRLSATQKLLEGLEHDAFEQHVKHLCGIVASALTRPGAEDEKESPVELNSILAAVEGLYTLYKRPKLKQSSFCRCVVLTILIRLSFFTLAKVLKKLPSKKGCKAFPLSSHEEVIASFITGVDQIFDARNSQKDSVNDDILLDLRSESLKKLMTLISSPDCITFENSECEGDEVKMTVADVAFFITWQLSSRGLTMHGDSNDTAPGHDTIEKARSWYYEHSIGISPSVDGDTQNLMVCLRSLLVHSFFLKLANHEDEDLDIDWFGAISDACLGTVVDGTGAANESQSTLVDMTVEYLSLEAEVSLKGVRNALTRVWAALSRCGKVSTSSIGALLSLIVGDEEKEEGTDEDVDDNSSDDDSSHEVEDDAIDSADDGATDSFQILDDLASDVSGSDDGFALHHEGTPEQDAALAQMIRLRKESRKIGLLQARRSNLTFRTRVIDVLEATLVRVTDFEVLLSVLGPLLQCIHGLESSGESGIQEEAVFERRLRQVCESSVCKKRGKMTSYEAEKYSYLCGELFQYARSKSSAIKNIAIQALMFISRVVLASDPDNSSAGVWKLQLSTGLGGSLLDFYSNRNSRISAKLFDEFILRFPEFVVTSSFDVVVEGCAAGKTAFLRSECCRFLVSLQKQAKVLKTQPYLMEMERSLSNTVVALKKSLAMCLVEKENGDSATRSDAKSKRIKLIVSCFKDVLSRILSAHENSRFSDVQPLIDLKDSLKQYLESEERGEKESISVPISAFYASLDYAVKVLVPANPGSSKKRTAIEASTNEKKRGKKGKSQSLV